MIKKLILIASIVVVAILQIFVIVKPFAGKYDIILNGEKFKFLVADFELENAKERGYVEINLKKQVSGIGEYGILRIDEDGFAELESVAVEKPIFGAYIKSSETEHFKFPFDKYYLKTTEWTTRKLEITEDTKAYIVVRIKDGMSEITDFFIDDMDIENYVK